MTTQNPKILLVDDEPHMLKTLRQLFAPQNYSIATAQCGTDAINCLSRQDVDLCVLDLIMPGMTGHEVMAYINDSRLETEVVVLSGDNHIDAAISALKYRAIAFIRKPFNPHELLNTVADALKRQMLRKKKKTLSFKRRQSDRLHRYLSNQFPDFIYLLDKSGMFLYVNKRVEPLLGYAMGELVGKHFSIIICERDLESAQHAFNERRTGDRATRNRAVRLKSKSGHLAANAADFRVVDIELNSIGVYLDFAKGTRNERGTLGVAREISLRDKSIETTNFQAYYDNLTGLPNRWLLMDRLSLALDHAKRHEHLLIVMFIDLDGFKNINDLLGYSTRDKILQLFAARLRSELRAGDTLARFGGYEFILMLPQIASVEQAEIIANKILENISKPLIINGKSVSITASIGISVFPKDGDSKDSLIERADSAMHKVKKHHKNSYSFYITEQTPIGQQPKQTLFEALELNQLMLVYQPQFNRSDKRLVALEALLRWQHPTKGLIFPDELLPIVRDYGLMSPIDEWVLKRVCSDFQDFAIIRQKQLRLSVNLSAEKISEQGFINELELILARNKVAAENIQVELHASVFSKPSEELINKLGHFVRMGGTVIAELTVDHMIPVEILLDCKIDGIKIDCSKFQEGSDEVVAIRILMEEAKKSGLKLIAKNVDSEQHLNCINKIDFDVVQGFLYYHPLSLKTAKLMLGDL